MARIRTIKPEFWASEQVMELSTLARLAFIGLWNFCDDAGVHTASSKRLKAELFPSDDITSDGVAALVAELIHHRLVGEFEAEGKLFWYVTGWSCHQRIDRPTYRHPTPPHQAQSHHAKDDTPTSDSQSPGNGSGEVREALDESSTSDPRALDEPSPAEGKGMDGKGKEKSIGAGAGASESDGDVLTSDADKPLADKRPSAAATGQSQSQSIGIRELVAEGVNPQHAEDWLKVRKASKKPLTQTAWTSTEREAAKFGVTPAEAVRIAAERGWIGFMASYAKSAGYEPGARHEVGKPKWASLVEVSL